jgi:hypothetical protein
MRGASLMHATRACLTLNADEGHFLSPLHARREDIKADSLLLQKEMQERHDEIAIDLEDRSTKKGTPPVPTESGDIRDLRGVRSSAAAGSRQRPAPMVE